MAHCASLVHAEEAHVVPLQEAPPHESCTTAGHAPDPLHEAASVTTPFEQERARQSTVFPGYVHCAGSLPAQVPPHAVPSEAHACRAPCGTPVTVAQVPTWPGTSQAWNCPPQLALQHTLSTHWPLAHWFAPPHAVPLLCKGVHTPAEQKSPVMQSVSLAQLPRQAVEPHTYGLQPWVCSAGQFPAPSHDAPSVATPALHVAPRHAVVG